MSSETPDIRLKRLRYRSWHRGCKETDIVLGHFSDTGLAALDAPELADYEALLEEQDSDIWEWLTGKSVPPEQYAALIERLKRVSVHS